MRTAYTVTRDVTPDECPWLAETVTAGTRVYRCTSPKYGCVRDFPATLDPEGGYPFFELPHDAVVEDTAHWRDQMNHYLDGLGPLTEGI